MKNQNNHKTFTLIKERAKHFKKTCIDHKNEIIIGSIIIAASGVAVYFGVKYFDGKKQIESQKTIISNLNKVIGLQKDVISESQNEINRLNNLIIVKDRFYATMSSDALRHRSSLGGQQLAYKRWYA